MIVLVLLIAFAHAGDSDADAVRARLIAEQDVETVAAEIAAARASGGDRSELARLMTEYRERAERLEAIDGPQVVAAEDSARRDRTQAQKALIDALARGTTDVASRRVLGDWLGDLDARIKTLGPTLEAALATEDPEFRSALVLDIADQAGIIAIVARYDAADADRVARRDATQAAGLRVRAGPGDGASLDVTVAAGRLERETAEAIARRDAAQARADAADKLRQQALAQENP